MEVFIFIFAIMKILGVVSSEEDCPTPDWRKGTRNNQSTVCFRYHSTSVAYNEAVRNCHIENSDLMTITNIQQIQGIVSVLNRTAMQVWSGVQIDIESGIKDIEILNEDYIDAKWKPRRAGVNDSCLEVIKTSSDNIRLRSRDCNETLPFICTYRKKENIIFIPFLPELGLSESTITALDYAAIAVGVLIGFVLIVVIIIDFLRKVNNLKKVDPENGIEMKV